MKDGIIGVNGAEAVLFIGKSLHIAGLDMQQHLVSVGKAKGFLNLGFIDVDAGCGIAVFIKQGKRRELSACSQSRTDRLISYSLQYCRKRYSGI